MEDKFGEWYLNYATWEFQGKETSLNFAIIMQILLLCYSRTQLVVNVMRPFYSVLWSHCGMFLFMKVVVSYSLALVVTWCCLFVYQNGAAGSAVPRPCARPCTRTCARPDPGVTGPTSTPSATATSFWDDEGTPATTPICTAAFWPQHAAHPTTRRHATTHGTSASTGDCFQISYQVFLYVSAGLNYFNFACGDMLHSNYRETYKDENKSVDVWAICSKEAIHQPHFNMTAP